MIRVSLQLESCGYFCNYGTVISIYIKSINLIVLYVCEFNSKIEALNNKTLPFRIITKATQEQMVCIVI